MALLMKYLQKENRELVFTSFEDEILHGDSQEQDILNIYKNLQPYRDRVEAYIRKNKNHITIQKLRNNIPITPEELKSLEEMLFDGDERGTKELFHLEFGPQPLGLFIRSIVGLDIKAANQAFADFLQPSNLTTNQMTFIRTIISYLEKNGTIDNRLLFAPPFTDLNDQGLLGVFDETDANKVINILDGVKENAGVGWNQNFAPYSFILSFIPNNIPTPIKPKKAMIKKKSKCRKSIHRHSMIIEIKSDNKIKEITMKLIL